MSRNLLFAQFGILAILAGLHLVGTVNFLYWRLPWFDLPSHFLGGLWSGLFAAWVLSLRGMTPRVLACTAVALALGLFWESFEVSNGIIDFPADVMDAVKDVFVGTLGGVAAFYLAVKVTDERERKGRS